MKRFLLPLFLILALAMRAAPLERDLGQSLVYHRVHVLPADLPAMGTARKRACVLDLRYVHGDAAAATALQAWIKFSASTRTPVFVLVNADTDAVLLHSFTEQGPVNGVMTVGIAGGKFHPDLVVHNSPENERRAYDALENGAAIVTLLTDNPDKMRNDEASLSKDRLAEAAADSAADALAKNRPAPPPVDVALQRAMHMHRALVALHKIPSPEPQKNQPPAAARK